MGQGFSSHSGAEQRARSGRLGAMTHVSSDLDLETALQHPRSFFPEPKDVVAHPTLSRDTKLAILREWELDARRLSASEGEGGRGARTPPCVAGNALTLACQGRRGRPHHHSRSHVSPTVRASKRRLGSCGCHTFRFRSATACPAPRALQCYGFRTCAGYEYGTAR